MFTFQETVAKLADFWQKQGCIISMPYDVEKGAGTANPVTFFRCLGPEPYRAAYIEPCRRPKDGRYATNPLRMQHYFQYQVILKPSPTNIQELYLQSLEAIGFDLSKYDIRFVHDDWEHPSLGAWGLGWEVWVDGMECTQFTYFQVMAEIPLKPVTGELTYGIERLIMQLQNVDSFIDIQWNDSITYGDIFTQNEIQWSEYNFEAANPKLKLIEFDVYQEEVTRLVDLDLAIPSYDYLLKASHAFNLLDALGVISVSERQRYIQKMRALARSVANCFIESRKKLGYPLLHKWEKYKEKPTVKTTEKLHKPTTNKTQNFLLEIGCEELPSSFVAIGLDNFERTLQELLKTEGLTFSSIHTYGTPRRLAVVIEALTTKTEKKVLEKKGPPLNQCFDSEGALTQVGRGFFKMLGLDTVTRRAIEENALANIEVRMIKNIPYLFAKTVIEEKEAYSILQKALCQIILDIDFPKKMRWADFDIEFARPIRWIVALLDDEVIPFAIGPVQSGRTSYGHRTLSPAPVTIPTASEYAQTLEKHHVIVDANVRRAEIEKQLAEIEQKTNAKALCKQQLCSEVTHLVEKPFLTTATFDMRFLQVPQEVLISEMVEHQKYFPLQHVDGVLSNHFVITCNVPATDSIRHGNQRVLSSRLADGVFLFEHDQEKPLESYNEILKTMIFQKDLGSMWDKVERLQKLAQSIASYVDGIHVEYLQQAITLCKADLVTEMVGEFPKLQGQMGKIYARLQNKPEEVCLAIDEHWMPKGEKAPLPQTQTGSVASICDKIDNLLGFFAIELKPTSSSDPYALRRQAIGLVRIILDKKLTLPLNEILQKACQIYPEPLRTKAIAASSELMQYLQARARGVLHEMGFAKDEIESCFAVRCDDFYDVLLRLETLKAFRQNPDFSSLVEVHKRSAGQINGFEQFHFKPELLKEHAEKSLHDVLENMTPLYTQAIQSRKYSDAFTVLSQFQKPLADLFDTVKILDDDMAIRQNRIALLQLVAALFLQITDFQKLQFS